MYFDTKLFFAAIPNLRTQKSYQRHLSCHIDVIERREETEQQPHRKHQTKLNWLALNAVFGVAFE